MVWSVTNAQCNESKKIVWEVARYLRGRGVDLGAGDFKVLPHVISVDNGNHEQFGFVVRPDVHSDCEKLDLFASQSLDFVYSSHLLEHIEDTAAALKEWWRVLRPGGYLVLYLPHKDFYPNIGEFGANPDHKHDFLPEDIIRQMPNGWDLVEKQDRNEDEEYSFLLVFKKRGDKQNRVIQRPLQAKTACVVRYGAYGDLMQASSVFSGLKAQGYHVTVFSSLPGAALVEHDPNIDELVLFDKDQVPNGDLVSFWAYQKKKFDKFVQLSESVEGTLLAMPGRTLHFYPPAARHRLMDVNYLEMQHMLAGVEHNPQINFYRTREEDMWCRDQLRRHKVDGPLVLWALAGSSVHKTWPYLDSALATILVTFPRAQIILVGGPECEMLEAGWENEPRVWKTSGKWTARQACAMLHEADVVIGPETGVLNAAACMPNQKIVFLSHSTNENLTRDWVNTVALTAPGTRCKGRGENDAPACHMLHYGWDHCDRDEQTGTAKCQSELTMDIVWPAIEQALVKVQK